MHVKPNKDFTHKQKNYYVQTGAVRCPKCGSSSIGFGGETADSHTQCSRWGECHQCGITWTNVYTLSNVIRSGA